MSAHAGAVVQPRGAREFRWVLCAAVARMGVPTRKGRIISNGEGEGAHVRICGFEWTGEGGLAGGTVDETFAHELLPV